MKHLNPTCPVIEIGDGNCPKCNPDPMKIPEVKNRDIFIKTCEMMFSHYRILKIVDIETAMKIIRGTLEI